MKKGDLVQLQVSASLDAYHKRREEIHGYLYIVERVHEMGLVEARSVATGVLVTFDRQRLKEAPEDVG